jgi:hypothetical protein
MWDGAFSLDRTVSSMEQDTKTYLRYVLAAVHGNDALHCTLHHHPQGSYDAQAPRVSNEIYLGGGWEIKWKIKWSDCIRKGCVCDNTFALSRTRSSTR